MLEQKVKEYFEKYSELKILFLFDNRQDYAEEISNWSDNEITLIKVEKDFFHLKYGLEYELGDKVKYFSTSIVINHPAMK